MNQRIKQIESKFTFLITIEFEENEYEYKIGDKLKVLVIAINYTDAINKFSKIHAGSEYPSYKIVSTEKIGDWMFYNLVDSKIILSNNKPN